MSGLEALGALGLACNVFQAVSFAREVGTVSRGILETGETPASAKSLANSLSNLTAITRDIESFTRSTSQSFGSLDTRLLEIAEDCSKTALELKAEIDKSSAATSSAKGHRLKSIRAAIGSVVRSRSKTVERLEKRLQTHQNTLEAQLLVNICSKADAAKLCQQDEFKKVDSTLRDFVRKLSEGETSMEALLNQQSESLKQHVTTKTAAITTAINDLTVESNKAARGLDGTITDINLLAAQEKKRERLLGSLKYPTMNSRRNQIVDPHAETFEWIFTGPQTPDDDAMDDGAITMWYDGSLVMDASAQFCGWLQDPDQSVFWVSGKPGSGKSTLVKFLADDPRTRTGLTSGPEPRDVVILSHFIWSAGQPIESSAKGMLCSLIRQFLEENDEMSDKVLGEFPKTKGKDTCSDWSEKELRSVLVFLLGNSTKLFCVFIDGLDEISASDGQSKLLELIGEIRSAPRIKMCVSSRPEPILQKHLGRFPMFRMQDLVHADIFKFTSGILRKRLIDSSIDLGATQYRKLICRICWIAEGVFLWVALAVRSLVVGLEKGDGMEELEQRLSLMPSELQDLYRAMWDRLGTEKQVYQRDSATYFNLLLLLQSDEEDWPLDFTCTPLQFLLATDSNLADRALMVTSQPLPPEDELRVRSNEMVHRLNTRCLGFLHISTWEESPDFMEIEFIHRSAKEFLETDAGGQALLNLDTSTKQERRFRLVKAQIAYCFLHDLGHIPVDSVHYPYGAMEFIGNIKKMCENSDISPHQAIQLSLLCRPLFQPFRWKELHWQEFPDLLGAAALVGYWRFLKQALENRHRPCHEVAAGPLSIPYVSYLLVMALQHVDFFEGEDQDFSFLKTVRWLLKHNINPNFPTRSEFDIGIIVSIPTTPLQAVLRLLINMNFPLAQSSPLFSVLMSLIQTGGDLSSTLILAVHCFPWPQEWYREKVPLHILSSMTRSLGVYIEVKTALLVELLVRKFIRHKMADLMGVEPLLGTLKSLATTGLSVKKVTVPERLEPQRNDWLDVPGREFHRGANKIFQLWNTEDPACLSRLERQLRDDPQSSDPSLPQEPSEHQDDGTDVLEITKSWVYEMAKDVEETGQLTTWGAVREDWLARDILWELDDPRRQIPKAWDT